MGINDKSEAKKVSIWDVEIEKCDTYYSAYINEINSGVNHETYIRLSAVVGGQHIVELTNFLSAH